MFVLYIYGLFSVLHINYCLILVVWHQLRSISVALETVKDINRSILIANLSDFPDE